MIGLKKRDIKSIESCAKAGGVSLLMFELIIAMIDDEQH